LWFSLNLKELPLPVAVATPQSPDAPAWLKSLASVCFNHKDGYFGLGRVIEIGRPWIDGSNMENFLISLPYPYGEKIEYMGNIRFFWLLPITDKEKNSKK